MLFGGGLFGGQLFVGALYGGAPESVPPPTPIPYVAATGGGASWPRLTRSSGRQTRAEAFRAMIQHDEEDVIMTVLARFIEEQDRWDL